MSPFAVTILLGAFLLFGVQPMLGRYLVPWFGGGASTWTTCLVFFQVMLLAGYAWAHGVVRRLAPGRGWKVHLVLVAASLAFLPLAPKAETWQSDGALLPPLGILVLLLVVVGLPYLVLASTGPLMQAWLSRTHPGRSPYRLYALSNVGSLLALCCYPFAIEPTMTLTAQGWWWSGIYVLFAGGTAACALRFQRAAGVATESRGRSPANADDSSNTNHTKGTASRIPAHRKWAWLACAAAGSLLMTATTSRVCEDLAGAPLLWVFPLAIYLTTFIICFDHDRWYRRSVFVPLTAVALTAVTLHIHGSLGVIEWGSFALYGAALFVACMVCHGELARAKPQPRDLTTFYMVVAAGGALGGVFAALVAPMIFPDYWEYHIGLVATALIAVVGSHRGWTRSPAMQQACVVVGGLACTGLAVVLVKQITTQRGGEHAGSRSFYGTLHVQTRSDALMRMQTLLFHGGVLHGTQFVDADKRSWPTTYYGRESGVGVAIAAARAGSEQGASHPLNIGVIGLGVGTIAALTESEDQLRVYEINPAVEEYARRHYSFLADCDARVEVMIGDGRRALEDELDRDAKNRFDVLAVDAFNGDTVPIHLLTREALAIYEKHLRGETGVVAFHVSNNYLDLIPVVRGLANAGGFDMYVVASAGEALRAGTNNAVWALLTRDPEFAADPHVRVAVEPAAAADIPARLWTDDFASVLPILKKGRSKPRWWQRAPLFGRFVVDDAWLLDRQAQDEMLQHLRLLYRDTERHCALVLASIDGLAASETMSARARELFTSFRLDGDKHHALLLVSRRGASAHLEVGPGWPATHARAAKEIVADAMGRASEAPLLDRVSEAVAELDRWMRREAAPGIGSPQLAEPPSPR